MIPVSRRFLDAPVTMYQAAAELGLQSPDGLEQIFRLPQFARLGLAGLSSGGVVRRDTWEDYYDQIARQLGLGVPISPIDGLIRADHLADELAFGLKISTNRSGNVFSPGDGMVINVINNTGQALFIELIGTSARGKKVCLSDGVFELPNRERFRFPAEGSIEIQPQLGVEFITVYARPTRFEEGELLRGDGVADRFIHPFYRYSHSDSRLENVPVQLIKKTIQIETR